MIAFTRDINGYSVSDGGLMNGIQLFNGIIDRNLIRNTRIFRGRASYLPAYGELFRNLKRSEGIRAEALRTDGLNRAPDPDPQRYQ